MYCLIFWQLLYNDFVLGVEISLSHSGYISPFKRLGGAFLDDDKMFGVSAGDFTSVSPVGDATENAFLRCQAYRPAELGAILEVGVQLKLCADLVQVGHLARDSSQSMPCNVKVTRKD